MRKGVLKLEFLGKVLPRGADELHGNPRVPQRCELAHPVADWLRPFGRGEPAPAAEAVAEAEARVPASGTA